MQTIVINSTPLVHVPNVVRWISECIKPFNPEKAADLYESVGIPPEAAADLATPEPIRTTLKYYEDYIVIEYTPPPS